MLSKLVREVMQGYGTRWAVQDSLSASVMQFLYDMPLPSCLNRSAAAEYMCSAIEQFFPLLRIPGILSAGSCLQVLLGHSGNVSSVAYSPDGKRIVSGSWDKTVRVWDAQTGEALHTLEGHSTVVTSVAYSPDGKRIESGR